MISASKKCPSCGNRRPNSELKLCYGKMVCADNDDCALDWQVRYSLKVVAAQNRARQRKEIDGRRETRKQLLALDQQTTSYWIKRIHAKAFNPWVRLRDIDLPCIACGKYDSEIPSPINGKWDAGHFRSVGSAKHLRFTPDNCHKQCYKCNRGGEMWSGKRDTVAMNYERNLIDKIGQDRVNALKFDNSIKRWQVSELKDIYELYKMKLKALKEVING